MKRRDFIKGINGVLLGAYPVAAAPSPVSDLQYETFILKSRVFPSSRSIRVLLPPRYAAASPEKVFPAFYFTDGIATFRSERLPEIGRRLMSQGAIPDYVFVGIDNGGSTVETKNPARDRANEYLPYADVSDPNLPHPEGAKFPFFLSTEVQPQIQRRFHVDASTHFGLGGSSYGAIAALYAAIALGGAVKQLLLESPPLFFDGGRLLKDAAEASTWPSRIYVGVGTDESDDPAINREGRAAIEQLLAIIRKTSPATDVFYYIAPGARHEASAWAQRLPIALEFLLND